MKTITKHYIDWAFVESHVREVMDSINPSYGRMIARIMLGDQEEARRAIAAAKRAFVSFARSTKEERANVLRRLHEVLASRIEDLTAAMDEEYGGVTLFSRRTVQMAAADECVADKFRTGAGNPSSLSSKCESNREVAHA
jgi:aldehyde dehydrogenase (NAD+)